MSDSSTVDTKACAANTNANAKGKAVNGKADEKQEKFGDEESQDGPGDNVAGGSEAGKEGEGKDEDEEDEPVRAPPPLQWCWPSDSNSGQGENDSDATRRGASGCGGRGERLGTHVDTSGVHRIGRREVLAG